MSEFLLHSIDLKELEVSGEIIEQKEEQSAEIKPRVESRVEPIGIGPKYGPIKRQESPTQPQTPRPESEVLKSHR